MSLLEKNPSFLYYNPPPPVTKGFKRLCLSPKRNYAMNLFMKLILTLLSKRFFIIRDLKVFMRWTHLSLSKRLKL